ncbi:g9137 [Coccomyxa elongata]
MTSTITFAYSAVNAREGANVRTGPITLLQPIQSRFVRRQSRVTHAVRLRGGVCRAQQGVSSPPTENGAVGTSDSVPTPIVKIDNQHDPFATVVTIEFGDRLGELLDTVAALKNLKLNIRRAKIKAGGGPIKFYITDALTSEKILKSARLEEIRLTIFNNLLKYHPESGSAIGWGEASTPVTDSIDPLHPLGARDGPKIKTTVEVTEEESGSHSKVSIRTRDRPGLLTDIVRTLKDISVNVISAEVDTEGAVAKDDFFVTYHGEPLNPSMTALVTNALQYYLQLAEVEREESY